MMLHQSYSQFGEDITAVNLFRSLETGFYVDIGAHHPLNHSNTALLHIRGWQGVNVEPMRKGYRAFKRFRPHAINVRAAIHNEQHTVTLYKFPRGLSNTIVADRMDRLKGRKQVVGEEIVPAMSLNRVFEQYVPDGTRVNYLTVDIEGYDAEAMLAFDLATYLPDVICVEIYRPDMLALGKDPLVTFLYDHGYQLYAINIYSFTFIHEQAAAADRLDVRRALALREISAQQPGR